MIIDAHTHIFPDDQASHILQKISSQFGVSTYGDGTERDLIERMDGCGISRAVVHMVAPTQDAVRETNSWLLSLDNDRFIKFGTLHPDYPEISDEIKRLQNGGARGIKLQPDIQQFHPDDRNRMYGMYEELTRQCMPVMFHVGGEPHPGPGDMSKPDMIRRVADDFPELTVIAAHLGGLNMWDSVLEELAGRENVFLESSLSYYFITPETGKKIIEAHGHEKVFFGTDYPFGDVRTSLDAARSVPFLTQSQREDILGNNAYSFFLR